MAVDIYTTYKDAEDALKAYFVPKATSGSAHSKTQNKGGTVTCTSEFCLRVEEFLNSAYVSYFRCASAAHLANAANCSAVTAKGCFTGSVKDGHYVKDGFLRWRVSLLPGSYATTRQPQDYSLSAWFCPGFSVWAPARAPSYTSAIPTIPPIEKWTVFGLRQTLINSDVQFSQRINKAHLYKLYFSLQSASLNGTRSGPPWALGHRGRSSESLGYTPHSAAEEFVSLFCLAINHCSSCLVPYVALPASPQPPKLFLLLVVQAQVFQHFPSTVSYPYPFPWPTAPAAEGCLR